MSGLELDIRWMRESDIKFAYDQVLELLIRISVVFLDDDGDEIDDVDEDVEHFRDFVIRKDLLVFSAAIRNFSEITGTASFMKNTKARLSELYLSSGWPYHRDACIDGKPSRPALIDLYKATSRILHAENVDIVSDQYEYLSKLSGSSKDYSTLISEYSTKGD